MRNFRRILSVFALVCFALIVACAPGGDSQKRSMASDKEIQIIIINFMQTENPDMTLNLPGVDWDIEACLLNCGFYRVSMDSLSSVIHRPDLFAGSYYNCYVRQKSRNLLVIANLDGSRLTIVKVL